MSAYDEWLARPYTEAEEGTDPCPECGEPLEEDKQERSVSCVACDYSDGYDWESEADARAEARVEPRDWEP